MSSDSTLVEGSVLELVAQAGPEAMAVLAVLLLFSLVSWGVMLERWLVFRNADRGATEFLRRFRELKSFSELRAATDGPARDPVSQMFESGFGELEQIYRHSSEGRGRDSGARAKIDPSRMAEVERALKRATLSENERLTRHLPFLATTASATPFIGLFGTVWGIMEAFRGIGLVGDASLATVAPGISEALVATAAGLGAAIPAVIGYNHFARRVRSLNARMEDFGLEFLNTVERRLR